MVADKTENAALEEIGALQDDSTPRRLLKEVAIRNMSTANLARGPAPTSKTSTVTESSPEFSHKSSRTGSADYDTPMTTVPNSPLIVSASSLKKRGRSAKVVLPSDTDEIEDEELALALQAEEYLENDSDEEDDSFVDDAEEDDFDDDESIASFEIAASSRQPPRKKQRLSSTRSRTSTNRFASEANGSAVLSRDESSPLSDLSSVEEADALSSLDEAIVQQPSKRDARALALLREELEVARVNEENAKAKRLERKLKKTEANIRGRMFAHLNVWERKKAMNRQRLEDNHPELKTMWKTLADIPIIKPDIISQPESINRKLKSFQLQGLDWMVKQEMTHYKGGLLGDEMGMGKTIQAVSLIMSDFPAKTPSLVVVPPVALMQWASEIKAYTDGRLKVLVFHGTNTKTKNMSEKDLKKFDVIIVSYNSLESLHRKETKGWSRGENIIREASPIHGIKFHRLILDEAHSIKSRNTGVAKACFALRGKYKWCLSGTPVQNRIGEFFSLLRFLEVRPFADYFCRSCSCQQLHWSLDDDHMCPHCRHSGAEHVSVFNQELLNPITGDNRKLREQALSKLHMITARMMLRRMKRDHTSSMELPPKEIVIHNEFFGEIERDFSSSIMTNSNRKFDTYVAQGVMLNNYANIFGLIMQMRQVANHPDLLLKKHAEGGQNVLVCNICDEPAEQAIRSRCHHEFCRPCVKAYMQTAEATGNSPDCPRCHIALSIDLEQPDIEQDEESVKKTSIINRIKMDNWTSSTKIEMLVYDLYKLRSKKQTLKSIVFSQFTSMLQLIEWRLRRAGFNTVMLDGSMTPAQRQKSIEYFMNNTDVEVFLVSLKAGGVALNLTEASRVFIVDP